LENCEESKISELVDHLVRFGEYGIPSLVQGLCSSREPVFMACRHTLQHEMERWEQLPTTECVRYYRCFSVALLDRATTFGTTAQAETKPFAQKMLRNLVAFPKTDSTDSRLVTRNCEQFLSIIATAQTKATNSNNPVTLDDSMEPSNTVANTAADNSVARMTRFDRGSFDTTLVTVQGTPFRSDISGDVPQGTDIAGQDAGDMFAASRAERLYAYHQSPLFQKQFGTASQNLSTESLPSRRLPDQNIPNDNAATEMLASMRPSRLPDSSLATAGSTDNLFAKPEGKIARNNRLPELSNSRPASEQHVSVRDSLLATDFSGETEDALPWEIREITLDKIANLSSSRLMRLLHHPDERYVAEARKTLISRDGFRDIHLKLAYRLYHPVSSVRLEIISLLPNTYGVRSDVWLSELLADPDNEVRYRAASFLATAGDPAMQRLVIDKGKRDSDARIVHLADQLLEQQRHRVRR
jgi:hypothetical protein